MSPGRLDGKVAVITGGANDNLFRMDFGKTMASAIPDARLVPLEGETVMYDPRDVAVIVQAVDSFLSGG